MGGFLKIEPHWNDFIVDFSQHLVDDFFSLIFNILVHVLPKTLLPLFPTMGKLGHRNPVMKPAFH